MRHGRATFVLLTIVVLCLYGLIVLWSLPMVAAEAGGLVPFDMRPGGYSFDEAQAFLQALSPRGRALYHEPQHWLDAVYPPLLGLWLFLACRALWPEGQRWGLWVIAATCAVVVLADWAENLLVLDLLLADPGALSAAQVARASTATLIKSGATTLAFVALLGLGVLKLVRRSGKAKG